MMDDRRFNLVDEPWIPVVGKDRVSLLDIFSDDSLRDIDGNAVQKLSLIKLFIAIAQASVRMEDEDDWSELGCEGLGKKVTEYLQTHHDCFYLYGERPFLQMPQVVNLDKVRESAIFYDYIPDLASDNDSILKETQMEQPLSDAEKAVFQIGLMDYALGGKRTTSVESLTPGYIKSKSAKSGPSTGNFVGYLHTYLKGESIRETVWFNFFTDSDIRAYQLKLEVRPPWENMPEGEDDLRARELRNSVYSWLVALSRFVLLGKTGIYYVEGIQYPGSVKEGYAEPFITINREKLRSIYVDVSKKPWRSLTSILQAAYEENSPWDCMIIRNFMHRAAEVSEYFTIWAGGLRVRGTSGDQSVKQNDDYVESEFLLNRHILGANCYTKLCDAVKRLDSQAMLLRKAVAGYYGKDSEDIQLSASSRYWEAADAVSSSIIGCWGRLDYEGMKKKADQLWYRMLDIYDDICPHETSSGLCKWIKNRPGSEKGGKDE